MLLRPRSRALCLALPLALAVSGCQADPVSAPPPPPSAPPAGSAVGAAGTVWTSGLNSNGQLGRPVAGQDLSLGPVTGTGGTGQLSGVRAVAGGARHSLAITDGGRVVAWGANDLGQLGDGTRRDRHVPVPVRAPDSGSGTLDDAVAISANNDFSMALRSDGTVVTWGDGRAGQRGTGRAESPTTPTTVRSPGGRRPLSQVVAIAADGRTELALRSNGQVFAWGANTYGMLGDGTRRSRALPGPVKGLDGRGRLSGVKRIAVGGQHGLALLADGRVVGWGRNELGQLGDGTTTDRPVPAPVRAVKGSGPLGNVVAISSAEKHNYALLKDGTAVAWGNNTAGQLGDDSVKLRTAPVRVAGAHGPVLHGIAQICAGEAYGVAVLSDGSPMTWGAGSRGQLGSGNRKPRDRPGTLVMAGGRLIDRVLAAGVGERHLVLVVAD